MELSEKEVNRYVITAATLQQYEKLATWWATTGFDELMLKRWLFLWSGGYPLFEKRLGLTDSIDIIIGSKILSELIKRVNSGFIAVESATTDDYPEALIAPTIDYPPTRIFRGDDHVTILGKLGDVYNNVNNLSIADVELMAISQEWIVPHVEPAPDRIGPSGSPLSYSYYEALKEFFSVNIHLIANISHEDVATSDRYYSLFGSQWPFGVESLGSLGNIIDVFDMYGHEEGSYELNLMFLGPHYELFLKYAINTILTEASTIFVVHSPVESVDAIESSYSATINDRVFAIYAGENAIIPNEKQLKTLELMLGKQRERKTITIPFISDYERTVLVGTRAEQIARGSKPRVPVDPTEVDPYPIAAREFAQKRIGLLVQRRMPNGEIEMIDPDLDYVQSHASPVDVLI